MSKTTPTPRRLTNSSWITSALYNQGTLELRKEDGEVLTYSGVPSWVMGLLCASKSPGRFYNKHLKNRYSYQRTLAPAPVGPTSAELCSVLEASIAQAAATVQNGGSQYARRQAHQVP